MDNLEGMKDLLEKHHIPYKQVANSLEFMDKNNNKIIFDALSASNGALLYLREIKPKQIFDMIFNSNESVSCDVVKDKSYVVVIHYKLDDDSSLHHTICLNNCPKFDFGTWFSNRIEHECGMFPVDGNERINVKYIKSIKCEIV